MEQMKIQYTETWYSKCTRAECLVSYTALLCYTKIVSSSNYAVFAYIMYNFHEITWSDNLPSQAMKLPLSFACTYPLAVSWDQAILHTKHYQRRLACSLVDKKKLPILSQVSSYLIVEGKYLKFTIFRITYILKKRTVAEPLPPFRMISQRWRHVIIYIEYVI